MWGPNARVYINGYEFGRTSLSEGLLLEGLRVSAGRQDTTEQPRAGVCTFSFVVDRDNYGSGYPQLTSSVRVTVEDSAGVEQYIFSGTITEITIEAQGVHYAPNKPVTVWQVTAASMMSELARRTITDVGFIVELEGDRIFTVLTEAGFGPESWDQISGTWASQAGTWLTFASPITAAAGLFDIAAIPITDIQNAFSLVTAAATSGLGIFYETGLGKFIYVDANHRRGQILAGIEKSYSLLTARSNFGYTSKAWDYINSATVSAADGTVSTYENTVSIAARGKISRSLSTTLDSVGTYEIAEALVLAGTNVPEYENLEFVLNKLSDTEIDNLVTTALGDYIALTHVPSILTPEQPTPAPGSGGYFTARGFVEGWTFNIRQNVATITLNWSPEDKTNYYITP